MSLLPKLLVTLITFYSLIILIIYFYQNKLLFFPDNTDFSNAPITENPLIKACELDHNGQHLRFYHYTNQGPSGWLIHFHGNAGSASERLTVINDFKDLGLDIILAEYPGFSNDNSLISESTLLENASALLDYIKKNSAQKPIILYGESLGTGVATPLAAQFRTDGLILQHPYTSIVDLAQFHYPLIPVKLILKNGFRSDKWAPQITVPTLALQGTDDATIPLKNVIKQINNFTNNPKFIIFPDKGHGDLLSNAPKYKAEINSFLLTILNKYHK